jgi:hypothetical protein
MGYEMKCRGERASGSAHKNARLEIYFLAHLRAFKNYSLQAIFFTKRHIRQIELPKAKQKIEI